MKGVLVLVSLDVFSGVVKGSASTVPVLVVPVEGGYHMQCVGSVLAASRGGARLFSTLDGAASFAARSIAPKAGRGFELVLRIECGGLF